MKHATTSHAEADRGLVSLRLGLAERALASLGRSPCLGLGAQMMLACDPEVWLRSIQLLQPAVEAAAGDATVFEVAETRPSSVLEMLQDLSAGISCGLRPRVMPASVARQRLVGAAESLLRASPEQAPTAAGLAATLGVPAPRLWRAIRAQYGMDLQHYLLFCPLAQVHKALRSAVWSGPLLRRIALAHGFRSTAQPKREYPSILSPGFSWAAMGRVHHQETAYRCCGMQPLNSRAATAEAATNAELTRT